MANAKISAMTALAAASVAADDVLPIVDTSAGTSGSKKITAADLLQAALNTTATGFSPTVVTPTQIAANTDNWALATGVVNRISSDAARNLTGMVAEGSGSLKLLWNVGTFPITLVHELTSTAANRFTCAGGASVVLGPGGLALLTYSTTTSRWLCTKVRGDIGEGTLVVRQPGGVAGTDEVQVYHDGTRGYIQSKDGGFQLLSTDGAVVWLGINSGNTTLDLGGAVTINRASALRLLLASDSYYLSSASQDWSFGRVAAGVCGAGSTATWLQNTPGTKRVTADVTNATTTFSNLTDLSVTLIAGRKYVGRLVVRAANTTAADGFKIDFNGGTATTTSFFTGVTGNAQGATLGTSVGATLAGVINATAMNGTGANWFVIDITIVCNAAGTFIPRFAGNSAASGTAYFFLGSYLILEDSPN